jgi:inner membrane protein
MMAGSHVAIGLAAWTLAAPVLGLPPLSPAALALAAAGALLPDIDHPHSWLGRRLPLVSRPLAALLGHRGVTHSLLAVAGCAWLLAAQGVARGIVAPLAVGALSHLAADALTPAGLRLAWPLRARVGLSLCRTGSAAEVAVVGAVVAAAGWRILGF